jgi:hypothetical protein
MRGRLWIALLLLAAMPPASCAIGPPPVPASFAIEYQTGSIPPPFNYGYVLTGTFEGDDLAVRYDLTYRFREGMTDEELAAQGYSRTDDIHWQGVLSGSESAAWRSLGGTTRLGPLPTQLPGGDSFVVTIRFVDGRELVGLPVRRSEWEALIDRVDKQARAETGNLRPSR